MISIQVYFQHSFIHHLIQLNTTPCRRGSSSGSVTSQHVTLEKLVYISVAPDSSFAMWLIINSLTILFTPQFLISCHMNLEATVYLVILACALSNSGNCPLLELGLIIHNTCDSISAWVSHLACLKYHTISHLYYHGTLFSFFKTTFKQTIFAYLDIYYLSSLCNISGGRNQVYFAAVVSLLPSTVPRRTQAFRTFCLKERKNKVLIISWQSKSQVNASNYQS